MLNKRQLLVSGASSIMLTMAKLSPAQAQVVAAFKIVIGAVGLLASGLGIFDEVNKWMADKRCSVPIVDLEDAKFRCQILARSITAPTTGVQETFGRLFRQQTDRELWHAFRLALGATLVDGGGVMEAFNKIARELGTDNYPGAKSDLENAYRSVNELRAAVAQVASLPDQSTVDDVNQAKQVFEALYPVVEKARKAEESLQAAINDRRQVKCP